MESLSPLRGHAVEVNVLKDTVGKLKALYVARRADEAAARTGARSPSAGADMTPPGYEMRVRLIRDGVELVDGVSLASAGIADGSRLVALEVRERAGLLWRTLRALGRWWPLLFCCWIALTIVVGTIDFTPGVDGHHACDRPLLSFLGMSAALLVPYGIVFSGAVQAEEGHRILWFLRSRKLSIVVAVDCVLSLVWVIVGAVWLFSPSSTCSGGFGLLQCLRRTAPNKPQDTASKHPPRM